MGRCDPSKLRLITVEPVLILFTLAGGLLSTTARALIYRKVCLSHYNTSLCENIDSGNFTEQENVVQSEASRWYMADAFCFEVASIATSFFYGILSDRVSRKGALLVPLIGQVFSTLNYILNGVFIQGPTGFIVIGPLCSGLCGGWVVCCLSAFSYLSDITSAKSRTSRIAIAEGFVTVMFATGQLCSGVIMDHTSEVFVFSISAALYSMAALYVIFGLRDTNKPQDVAGGVPGEGRDLGEGVASAATATAAAAAANATATTTATATVETPRPKPAWRQVCSPTQVRSTFTLVFRKRSLGGRTTILTLFSILIMIHLVSSPTWTLGYLYLKRYPLSWSQSLYGYYSGVYSIPRGLFVLLLLPVIKDKLRCQETTIMFCAVCSYAAGELLFGFATVTWMVFLVPVVALAGDCQATCLRSLLSTTVEKNELGQMFAVYGSLQSFSGVLAGLIYNNLYPVTLDLWGGICFVLGASASVVPLSLIGWLHYRFKNAKRYGRLVEETEYYPADNKPDPSPDAIDITAHMVDTVDM